MQRYAVGDVAHLFALTDELERRLGESGRSEWVTDECEMLRTAPATRQEPETAWWKVKGARSLRGESARIAQSVAAWREERAREVDRPARFVLSDLLLAGVVARPPSRPADLAKLRGGGSLPEPVVRGVLGAVAAGRAMDAAALRTPPRIGDDPALDAAVGLLAAWTAQIASGEQIEARLLATREDVKAMVNGRSSRLDVGWRAAGRRRPAARPAHRRGRASPRRRRTPPRPRTRARTCAVSAPEPPAPPGDDDPTIVIPRLTRSQRQQAARRHGIHIGWFVYAFAVVAVIVGAAFLAVR